MKNDKSKALFEINAPRITPMTKKKEVANTATSHQTRFFKRYRRYNSVACSTNSLSVKLVVCSALNPPLMLMS